jgi:hypothetical protein
MPKSKRCLQNVATYMPKSKKFLQNVATYMPNPETVALLLYGCKIWSLTLGQQHKLQVHPALIV